MSELFILLRILSARLRRVRYRPELARETPLATDFRVDKTRGPESPRSDEGWADNMSANATAFLVGDRRVYVTSDPVNPETQIISICTEENTWGRFARVFRVSSTVTRHRISLFRTVSELVDWLQWMGAHDEGVAADHVVSPSTNKPVAGKHAASDEPMLPSAFATIVTEIAALAAMLDSAEADADREHSAAVLSEQLSTLDELDQRLNDTISLVQSIRATVAGHMSRAAADAEQRRRDLAEFRQRLVIIEEQLVALNGSSTEDSDPHPAPVPPASPFTASPAHLEPDLFEVLETLSLPDSPQRRLVALPLGISVAWVRRQLPREWALFPGKDDIDASHLLIYQALEAPASDVALEIADLLVDLLATLQPADLFDDPLYDMIWRSLPGIEQVLGPVAERVLARACFRLAEPIHREDVVAVAMNVIERNQFMRLLKDIVSERDDLASQLPDVERLVEAGSNSPAQILQPTPMVVVGARELPPAVPREGRIESFDSELIERRREETRIAQECLRELDEQNAEIEDDPEEGVDGHNILSLPPRHRSFAERLAERDEYTEAEVRLLARSHGLILGDAIPLINEWADRVAEARNLSNDAAVIEVAEDGIVWVDEVMRELLA